MTFKTADECQLVHWFISSIILLPETDNDTTKAHSVSFKVLKSAKISLLPCFFVNNFTRVHSKHKRMNHYFSPNIRGPLEINLVVSKQKHN